MFGRNRRPLYYVFDDLTKKVIPLDNTQSLDWAIYFENYNRKIAFDELEDCQVSTVFLGLDHNIFGEEPHVFETMVFGGKFDTYARRYSTYAQALEGHFEVVHMVKSIGIMSQEDGEDSDAGDCNKV